MKSIKRKGFTLIELMIVISIIGVLAAIAIPNFRQARIKSNTRACYANQKTILGALEMYNLDEGTDLKVEGKSTLATLVGRKYMQSAPADPGCKDGDNYRSNNDGDVWCVFHGTVDNQCVGSDCFPGETGTCSTSG
ncbi:MAG: hypothetical protein COB02_00895 [Candidatus Cloacimonadota bacterium]|nr:MAG: hypothetical protein COB02_00895 [Candidatus Cloacimonadota bacterium]